MNGRPVAHARVARASTGSVHAIHRDEVPPGVGHELLVGRMVDRLHAEDLASKSGWCLCAYRRK
jgi:hypothetical protein